MIPERIDRNSGARLATIHRNPWSLATTPILGPRGLLTFGDNSVCLSERNAQLAGVFVYHFGSELSDVELLHRVWPDGATSRTLRLHLRRLDRRLARVGLTIVDYGNGAHALVPVDTA